MSSPHFATAAVSCSDGTLSWPSATCEPAQCPLIGSPGPGSVGYSDPGRGYASTATYTCDPGYDILVTDSLRGPGRYTRTCVTSGEVAEWSGDERTCGAVTCRALPIPEGATVSYSVESRVYPVQATITCDESLGYFYASGDIVRDCVDKNTWSGQVTVCADAVCPLYSFPPSIAGDCACKFHSMIVSPGELCCGPRDPCPAGLHYANSDACDSATGEYESATCTPAPCPLGTEPSGDPDPAKACRCPELSRGIVEWSGSTWTQSCTPGTCVGSSRE